MSEDEAKSLIKLDIKLKEAIEKIKHLENELYKLKSDRWIKFDRAEHEEVLVSGELIRARIIKNGTDGFAYYTRNYWDILPTLKDAKREAISALELEDA